MSPWRPGDGCGFSTHPRPWLSVARTDGETVAVQRADATSTLSRFRALLRARRSLSAAGPVEWIGSRPVVAYRRDDVVVALNAGATPTDFRAPGPGAVVYSTAAAEPPSDVHGPILTLAPDEAVIVRLATRRRAGAA